MILQGLGAQTTPQTWPEILEFVWVQKVFVVYLCIWLHMYGCNSSSYLINLKYINIIYKLYNIFDIRTFSHIYIYLKPRDPTSPPTNSRNWCLPFFVFSVRSPCMTTWTSMSFWLSWPITMFGECPVVLVGRDWDFMEEETVSPGWLYMYWYECGW